jgi:hypothetical protein
VPVAHAPQLAARTKGSWSALCAKMQAGMACSAMPLPACPLKCSAQIMALRLRSVRIVVSIQLLVPWVRNRVNNRTPPRGYILPSPITLLLQALARASCRSGSRVTP